jgi:hypothetical protein
VLEAYRPDVVLIEGPPEADALTGLAAAEGMRPPVALLAYPAETKPAGRSATGRSRAAASFWPFADFSPEWQAIRWAVSNGVPVRFCDLPTTHRFATRRAKEPDAGPDDGEPGAGEPGEPGAGEPGEPGAGEPGGPELGGSGGPSDLDAPSDVDENEGPAEAVRHDPIGLLAEAAGYDDPERWWEDLVEHQLPVPGEDELTAALAPFEAIAAAMAEVRAATPALPRREQVEEDRREAYMRTTLRAAQKRFSRVVVVCGAWHVPALTAPLPPANADAKVLRGLPKARVAVTWVPWTHGRLASWQGYGAGVTSPGWYHHLFTSRDRPVTRWLVKVAEVLRQEGLPVSSAHVIEAVRLAETLATLRRRPLAGLAEVTEATRAVLCDGDDLRVALVDKRLVVGEQLGAVPEETPSVPLVVDVGAAQRRLRMRPSALETDLDLDLRRDIDLERSRLLHRLRLLGVSWGTPAGDYGRRGRGTFWESWRLAWEPEFAVDLIEASGYGTTVAAAAAAKAVELAKDAASLSEVTSLVGQCLLADLPEASPTVLAALQERAALDSDVSHLMAALPALARTLRYGDVRATDVTSVLAVTRGLVIRICVGLPAAVAALDDDAAAEMRTHLDGVDSALGLLGDETLTTTWLDTLQRLSTRDDVHGVLSGRMTRMLLDRARLDSAEVSRRMGLALTIGVPPARSAAWVEGFLAGGGLLLVHDEQLLALVDAWLMGIPADTFVEVLPLLRRTFSGYPAPERRAIGDRVRHVGTGTDPRRAPADVDLDLDRAALVRPTLELLLGRDLLPAPPPREEDQT